MRISSIIFAAVLILVSSNIMYAQPSENEGTRYLFRNMFFHSEIPCRYPVKIILLNGRVIVEDAALFYYPDLQRLVLEIPNTKKLRHFIDKAQEKFPYLKSAIKLKGSSYIIRFLIKSPSPFKTTTVERQEDKPLIVVDTISYQDRPSPILMVKCEQNNLQLEILR